MVNSLWMGRGERVIKATVTFLVLVRGKIFLYHLKAYIYGFIFFTMMGVKNEKVLRLKMKPYI